MEDQGKDNDEKTIDAAKQVYKETESAIQKFTVDCSPEVGKLLARSEMDYRQIFDTYKSAAQIASELTPSIATQLALAEKATAKLSASMSASMKLAADMGKSLTASFYSPEFLAAANRFTDQSRMISQSLSQSSLVKQLSLMSSQIASLTIPSLRAYQKIIDNMDGYGITAIVSRLASLSQEFASSHAIRESLVYLHSFPRNRLDWLYKDTKLHLDIDPLETDTLRPYVKYDNEAEKTIPVPLQNLKDYLAIKDLCDDISETDIIMFICNLCKIPMLALDDPVGKKIQYIIQHKYMHWIDTIPEGTTLFRARKKSEKGYGFFPSQMMLAPPAGVSSQGRFNMPGSSMGYFSSDPKTTLKELGNVASNDVCCWKYKTNHPIRILKLFDKSNIIFKYCLASTSNQSAPRKLEYDFPNFFANCLMQLNDMLASENKIQGIVYPSVQCSASTNYAFFYFDERDSMPPTLVDDFS